MSERNLWFHRGKYARLQNKERTVDDGRVSPENRQQFYEGWDVQDRYLQPKLTAEQEKETNESLAGIRQFLEASGYKKTPETKA